MEKHNDVILSHKLLEAPVPDLMTLPEVADYLRVPEKSLYIWRYKGTGPPAARVGRHLRYRRNDVDRWLNEQTKTSQGGGHAA
jgi:excisionase family DNA binding protein